MFRRIPRPSTRRMLRATLFLVVVALAFPLVGRQQPEEPGIRFRYPGTWEYGYLSLDQPEIIDLFHLDLSGFQFTPDFPLTIDRSVVYLKVSYGSGQILVPTDFSLSHNCTPSPDLKRLLCGSPANADILALPAEQQDLATGEWRDHLFFHKGFFVITPGNPWVYVIPDPDCRYCGFDSKTSCRWASTSRIYCTRSQGSGVWGTDLFDLASRSYAELPHQGNNIVEDSRFAKGYIYFDMNFYPHPLEVYDLAGTMIYQGLVEDWIASEDTIAYVGPCGEQSFCVGRLRFDNRGLNAKQQKVLDTSRSTPNEAGNIMETNEEYLVTNNEKVFVLSKKTLQVRRILEFPAAKLEPYEPQMIALYRDNDLLIAGPRGLLSEQESGATLFDLSKCQARLDDSCEVQTWNSVQRPDADVPSLYDVRRHIRYFPANRPDLIFSVDEDASVLTICSLKSGTDYPFGLAGVPKLVATSTDGRFLLVATTPDHWTSLYDAQFHLFDLRSMQPDTRELVMGKNLFLVPASAY